jgi:TolB-like protein/Flp pilus assembly protein TadD
VERKGQLVTRDEIVSRLWAASISVELSPPSTTPFGKSAPHFTIRPSSRLILKPWSARLPIHRRPRSDRYPAGSSAARNEKSQASKADPGDDTNRRGDRGARLGNRRTLFPARVSFPRRLAPTKSVRDPAQNYFAEGITDELTTDIAQATSLRVVSRTSTLQYREHPKPIPQIAKELNVDAVLEGSVLREDNKVRVTVQLIDARRDAHIWAQSYERDFGGILNLQRAVALDIAAKVRAKISPQIRQRAPARKVRPEVYEAYLWGRHELTQQNRDNALRKAEQYFERAIDLDPLYPAAYAGLADAFGLMANYAVLLPADGFPRAEAAARRALEFDPALAEAHASLGFILHHWDWDWTGAESEYKQALELAPSLAVAHLRYAEFLSHSGRHDEAIREIEKARECDPLSSAVLSNVGRILFWARRYDDAIRELNTQLSLDPNRAFARAHLGLSYLQKRMYPQAISEFQRADALLGVAGGVGSALAYAMSGQTEAALRLMPAIEDPNEAGVVDWVFVAGVYAAIGDKEKAFQRLDSGLRYRDVFMTALKVYPFLDPLRADPRFTSLVQAVRIP